MSRSTKSTLDERIAKAQVEVANMACAQPHIWPEWQRLQTAKDNLKKAEAALPIAQAAWDKLIEHAEPKYKALLE